MKLTEVKVKNFRSIGDEQTLPTENPITIVGPNNSGKTNILKSIQMLFTGLDNKYQYSPPRDLNNDAGKERTSISAKFTGIPDGEDDWFYKEIDILHKLQGTTRSGSEVALNLYFSESGSPIYNFFPNIKRPREVSKNKRYSKVTRDLIEKLINSFSIHYIPSDKSTETLYSELLFPFLKKSIEEVLEQKREAAQQELDNASLNITEAMKSFGQTGIVAEFKIPEESISSLISKIDFIISDPLPTTYDRKGMGIQASAIFSAMSWITDQEKKSGKSTIWLIEEPESYLHPTLAKQCARTIYNLGDKATTITTTHSLSFVPSNPRDIRGANRAGNKTILSTYKTSTEAGESIRRSLGVKFSDYFGMSRYNILVEGQSDRETIHWILQKYSEISAPSGPSREAEVIDFGGVKHLSGFLRATYPLFEKETASISIFDGDDAGVKERKELQGFFANKGIGFQSNQNFVSIRSGFAIEGLFPDEWITSMQKHHPEWFDHYSVDMDGKLEPFKIKDEKKKNAMALLKEMANTSTDNRWMARFDTLIKTIDKSLTSQELKINSRLSHPEKQKTRQPTKQAHQQVATT